MSPRSPLLKAHRILHLVLVAFLLIGLRVWHLGTIQREEKLKEAQRPKLRTTWLRADRGAIFDRFHIPLAVNKICYNASVYYGQIAQIPTLSWSLDETGQKTKIFPRKEYIKELSFLLSDLLSLEPQRVEDLIHSKASLLPHVPYILKKNLTEEQYYRLKMLEKDWPGLSAEIGSERFYPQGKTACHLLGSLGSIAEKEYRAIVEEIHLLEKAKQEFEAGAFATPLPAHYNSFEAVQRRLYELKEKAYSVNDRIGKSGIEKAFEEQLRGFWGVKTYEVDQKGKVIQELPSSKAPLAGREIVLTISSELQAFAEELLIRSEKERQGRSLGIDPVDHERKIQKQPWIKGGAIVALDPKSGEILAFASHPRHDPNDLAKNRWLETPKWVATPWNGEASLSREWVQGKKIGEETTIVHWEFFLDQLLPSDGPLRQLFAKENDIKSAISLQEDFETLLYFANSHDGKKVLEALFSQELEALRTSDKAAGPMKHLEASLGPLAPLDRLYALDLYRLAICSPRFSDPLLAKIGTMKLATYRSLEQAFCRFEKAVKKEAFEKFHREDFTKWREEHQKAFLLEKRKKEKENKIYVHPYLDYLDQKEKERFSYFWEEHRYEILQQHLKTHPEGEPLERVIAHFPEELVLEFLRTFRPFDELDRPLFFNPEQTEKDLAASFYPKGGYGFSRSYAYQTAAPLGSLFKLIGSYEGLRQGHSLQIIDEYNPEIPSNKQPVAYSPSRVPYPRQYKGGRLPRSSSSQIGKIDLIGAIEHSSNPFFSLLAGDFFSHPEDLNRAAHLFGLGEKTDIALPGETAGSLPTDLATHKTGLYSYAIGQHTLLATPLQSALMLSTFVNGGSLLRPKIIRTLSGFEASRDPFSQENRFAKKELEAVGIPYPLFTAIQSRTPHLAKTEPASEVRWKVSIPPSIKFPILEGMHRSLWSGKGNARPPSIRTLLGNPAWMRDFLSLENQMIGKTSTAEIKINPNLNPSSRAQMYKHIWFGAASFDAPPSAPAKIRWDHPELVVLVFLRYGDAGREAAPLAAEMIVKWREIKKKHMSGS